MRKYLACCAGSAVIGGLLAVYLHDEGPLRAAQAQDGQLRPPANVASDTVAALDSVRRLPDDELTPEERVNVAVYEKVNRSVVNIDTKGVRGETFLFMEIPSQGMGSGSVLDKEGRILTNYHVVEGAREIEVSLFNGRSYLAKKIGEDASSDLAVIQIDAPPEMLHPVTIGGSAHLKVGQRVFAIGNPFGLDRTLTTGIISSLNRALPSRNHRRIGSVIQIDAAINPGSSGGPLLDSRGRLIGMNTAIASKTGQNTGVGFAIPAATIARLLPQLIENGRVTRPDVGIVRVYQTEHGLLVEELAPGGPAERAGMRGPQLRKERRRQGPFVYEYQQIDRSAADLIVGVDGTAIATADDFLTLIESKQPGDAAGIHVIRQGQEVVVNVTLAREAN